MYVRVGVLCRWCRWCVGVVLLSYGKVIIVPWALMGTTMCAALEWTRLWPACIVRNHAVAAPCETELTQHCIFRAWSRWIATTVYTSCGIISHPGVDRTRVFDRIPAKIVFFFLNHKRWREGGREGGRERGRDREREREREVIYVMVILCVHRLVPTPLCDKWGVRLPECQGGHKCWSCDRRAYKIFTASHNGTMGFCWQKNMANW